MAGQTAPRHGQNANSPAGPGGSLASGTLGKPVFEVAGFAANLPKGGGAIRGINERINIDAYRGSAHLSVPLPINPVRGGIGLELSFDYDAGAGNGPFGIGWSVGIPSIFRRSDKGVPRYDDDQESDCFVAPGADELVRVTDAAGKAIVRFYSPDGRLLPSVPAGEYYETRSYRARVDRSFSRIEWWRRIEPTTDGGTICRDSFWRILTKANITSLYGFSPSARLAAPDEAGGVSRIFQWQLDRSFDDRGNAIQYEYAGDDGKEGGLHFTSPRYLTRVKYGNRSPYDRKDWLNPLAGAFGKDEWLFELAFDFGSPIGDPQQTIEAVLAAVAQSAGKDRCVPPAEGPVRPDSFTSFRSGFPIRTRRLCRRILSYHHIPGEYDGLARTLELTYDENPYLSRLVAITQVAWNGTTAGTFPPLQLSYAGVPDLTKARLQRLAPDALPTLRGSLDRPRYSWIDLDAEGAPGALFQSAGGAWLFARNSSGGKFTAPQPVAYQPALAGALGATAATAPVMLLDLGGDGQLDAVEFDRPDAGFRERAGDYTWDRFVPFAHSPALDPNDANVRFFDLDGDGLSDVVWSEQGAYVWQRSLGVDGFALPERLNWASEEKRGPRLLFADRNSTVYLADMSGDGLIDLVRIRNGEVCYWPNLGHGKFGARVRLTLRTEDGTDTGEQVVFDRSELFSPRRIRLLDIDGTGSTDLAYLGANGLRCWRNQSGNGFSRPIAIPFPPIDDPDAVSVVDLLANGTACLVLAPGTPDPATALQYLHLVGAQSSDPDLASDRMSSPKPHILVRYTNNLGGETLFHYTSSAQFCVQDRDNGRPWFTKLGFPVQVIERVEHRDWVTGKILVNSYRYRHGHYDGKEREFCGFAHVEQCDSVRFEDFSGHGLAAFGADAANVDAAFHLPAAVTRTWFHTGAVLKGDTLSRRLASEYFGSDAEAVLLPDTTLPSLCEAESVEAVRALKGSMLRQEIYSGEDDGSVLPGARPYTVSERSYVVRRLQPAGENRHAAFDVHPAEQLDYHYEQQLDDPRIEHQFTLEVDAWGNVLQSAHAAYGRRTAGLTRDLAYLNDDEWAIQSRTSLEYSLRRYTSEIADPIVGPLDHQAPLLSEHVSWEITGLEPSGPKGFYRQSDLHALHAAAALLDVPYQTEPGFGLARRRIAHVRQHYWDAVQDKALPLGRLAIPALPHQAFKLAFTPDMVADLADEAGELVSPSRMADAGYQRRRDLPSALFPATGAWPDDADAESWWASSPFLQHKAKSFFVPIRHFDSFYAATDQEFGAGSLMPERIVDPVKNETRINNDYRLMQPQRITDANDSVTELRFDRRGMVAAIALRGNGSLPTKDDLDGITADLNAADLKTFRENPVPLAQPGSGSTASIRHATSRFIYDLFAACKVERMIGKTVRAAERPLAPVWAATLARQFHVGQNAAAPVEIAFAYSTGFGEIAQTKQLTAPGPVDPADGGPSGNPRWIGSGWQIHDNKNAVVRQYEPFFTATHGFERGRIAGSTHTTFYDPLRRMTARLTPHRVFQSSGAVADAAPIGHSYEKQVRGAWGDAAWDGNDTVLTDPREDTDVGALFRKLPQADVSPTWHRQRTDPLLSEASWPGDERRQRWESEAATRTAAHAATPVRSFLDPRGRVFLSVTHHRRDAHGRDELFHTRTDHDIEGNQRAVIDAKGRAVMRWDYAMVGLPWRSRSMDSGKRLMLVAVDGKPAAEWDAMQRRITHRYDALRRPLEVRVRESGSEVARESYLYGENAPNAKAAYLRGRLHRQQDDGGTLTIARYDWHGQPVETSRAGTTRTDRFDAQVRHIESNCDGSSITRKYSLSGQLVQVSSSHGGTVVAGITYGPAGERRTLDHGGDGPGIAYVFDPLTGRLHFQRAGSFQDLHHVFDPAGNINHVWDDSQEVEHFDGQRIEPLSQFTYDSLYRLTRANGREHCSRTSGTWNERYEAGSPFELCAHPSDRHAFRNYSESYEYDAVGNLLRQRHVAGSGSWTRNFEVELSSNRLRRASVGNLEDTFDYDAHGNVRRLAHLERLDWDYRDRLIATVRAGQQSRCAYDASGQRVVKEEPGGTRRYFGDFEFFSTGSATRSVVVREGAGILAIIDRGGGSAQVRLQLPNHLGSCGVEVDMASGDLLAREEFYPYGGSSYQARVSGAPARRYRFTAKERDESTGLSYHGARYYAPWLARWISEDPVGVDDGPNRFQYVYCNPIRLIDREGESATEVLSGAWEQTKEFAHSAALGAAIGLGIGLGIAAVGAAGTLGAAAAAVATIAVTTVAAVGAMTAAYGAVKGGIEAATGRDAWGTGQQLTDFERGGRAAASALNALTALISARAVSKAIPQISRQLTSLSSRIFASETNPFKNMSSAERSNLMKTKAEANAMRRLQEMQEERPGSHFLDRHGPQVSRESQLTRADSGIIPTGEIKMKVRAATRFDSARDQLNAIMRAEKIFERTGSFEFAERPIKFGYRIGEGYNASLTHGIQDSAVVRIDITGQAYGKAFTAFPYFPKN